MRIRICGWAFGWLLAGFVGHADTVSLGDVAFNTLIPAAPGSPGVNIFSIDNFTDGFSLPPDFPVLDPLILMDASLQVNMTGGSETISLGDLTPGSYTPELLEFPSTEMFTSAVLTAVLSQTVFQLSDGTTFAASSSQIQLLVSPSTGPFLSPDTDFAVVNVSGVPEPRTAILLLIGIVGVCIVKQKLVF